MTKLSEVFKTVEAATTAEEVETELRKCTRREMSLVYMRLVGAPFCVSSSRVSDEERARELTRKIMRWKLSGVRAIG